MLAAVNAVANGGVWVQPHAVQSVIDPATGKSTPVVPTTRRVISTAAAATLAQMMTGVVEDKGAEGSMALTDDGIFRANALRLDRIVDPVGAGDGFAAGFLSGQLRGWGIAESLRLGNVVGASAMSVGGDVEGLPTWEEVQSLDSGRDVAR